MNTESIIAEYADTILEDEDLHTNGIATNIDYRANECDVEIENLVEKYSKLDINSKYLDSFNITMDVLMRTGMLQPISICCKTTIRFSRKIKF